MLEVAEKFETAFSKLEGTDLNYLSYFDKSKNIGPPNSEDWEKSRVLVKFLKLFYHVTLRFSGSLYVTSNAFFHELMALIDRLQTLMVGGNPMLVSMAAQMKKKLEKYWDNNPNLNYLLFVAVVLDPRYKLAYVKYCFEEVYDELKAKEMGDRVETTLLRLYDHYVASKSLGFATCNFNSQVVEDVDTENMEVDHILSFQAKYARHRKEKQSLESKSEVARYLAEPCEEIIEKFDVLGWWKVNANNYPFLSQVAKDVLAIPVSTVASESAFSTSGRILDPFRSSLSPLMVEALVCCQNWLKSTPIDLREAMDNVEAYDEVESEFAGLSSLTIEE